MVLATWGVSLDEELGALGDQGYNSLYSSRQHPYSQEQLHRFYGSSAVHFYSLYKSKTRRMNKSVRKAKHPNNKFISIKQRRRCKLHHLDLPSSPSQSPGYIIIHRNVGEERESCDSEQKRQERENTDTYYNDRCCRKGLTLAPTETTWLKISLQNKIEIFARLLQSLLVNTVVNIVLGSSWTTGHRVIRIGSPTLLIADEVTHTAIRWIWSIDDGKKNVSCKSGCIKRHGRNSVLWSSGPTCINITQQLTLNRHRNLLRTFQRVHDGPRRSALGMIENTLLRRNS